MKFIVEYSIERDMYNYLNTVWKMKYKLFGREDLQKRLLGRYPKTFQDKIQGAKTEEEAKRIIVTFLESFTDVCKKEIQSKVFEIQRVLDKEKDGVIDLLETVYNRYFTFEEVFVYLTTNGICPYDYAGRWLMIDKKDKVDSFKRIATHELNHFMFFHYYFDDLKKRNIDLHKLMVLKEALVVLSGDDTDYKPETVELKQFLKSMEGKPMDEIIELAIKSEAFANIESRA